MNVVFDFGAVLFTWEPVVLMQKHFSQLAPTAEAAHELARSIFHHEDWVGFDRGTHGMEEVLHRVATRLDLPRAGLDAALSPIGERLLPIPETVAMLTALRDRREAGEDIRLYYLSNMPEPYARTLERKYEIIQWFDGGIFSGDVKLVKPDAAIYELLARRYALEPTKTIFIDDMAANVQAARDLGWQGIHCESPALLAKQLAPLLPTGA